jgi:sigma-B regulation protein RsbU (phosphoserine phosphatase)
MTFAAGGQPPVILVSNGTIRLLASRTGILGCLPEAAQPAAIEEVELVPGDRLVFYTDGLVEVFNQSGDMLGVEGLEKIVLQSATLALPEMKQAILDGVTAWRHGVMADDVSLVVIEVR